MKKITILIFILVTYINFVCFASVYDISLRSFSEGKVYVIEKSKVVLGNDKRAVDRSDYIPVIIKDFNRLNNREPKQLVFDHDKYIWTLEGKKISANGTVGENARCIIASIPVACDLSGEKYLDLVSDVSYSVDYAFCEPIGNRDWILSGKDSGLALLPKDLWFKDVKNDVPEYMKKLKIYEAAEEDGRLKLLMDDLKKWSDIRGLAVLEKLIELPSINVKDITSILNSKGNEFQIHSLSVILNSNMPKDKKMQFTDPKSESSIKNTVPLLNLLAKWPIDPEDNFMIQVNLLLKQFTSN